MHCSSRVDCARLQQKMDKRPKESQTHYNLLHASGILFWNVRPCRHSQTMTLRIFARVLVPLVSFGTFTFNLNLTSATAYRMSGGQWSSSLSNCSCICTLPLHLYAVDIMKNKPTVQPFCFQTFWMGLFRLVDVRPAKDQTATTVAQTVKVIIKSRTDGASLALAVLGLESFISLHWETAALLKPFG